MEQRITTNSLVKPKLKADNTEHDFGNITPGVHTHNFLLTNVSDKDIVILLAKASCGCTSPTYEQGKVIKPEESTVITARYNTDSPSVQNGVFNKSVTVKYNYHVIDSNKSLTPSQKHLTEQAIILHFKGKINRS
ncbi:MAG TPA: DUF1573 domain-containing protein [Burkholderiales bacterium]|nr:DUF1573 domain-containing protein [Burkholderiales bacterium]